METFKNIFKKNKKRKKDSDNKNKGKKLKSKNEKKNENVKREEKRILVIGSVGVGKSSLCQNLGCSAAIAENAPVGVTLTFKDHNIDKKFEIKDESMLMDYIKGCNFILTDTCGLNEKKSGSVLNKEAIRNFFKFVKSHPEGFNIVILVTSNRTDVNLESNIDLIQAMLGEIPILLCITNSKKDLKNKTHTCVVIKGEHKYIEHYTLMGIEEKMILYVDTPGKDITDDDKKDGNWTKREQDRLDKSIKDVWFAINMNSQKTYKLDEGKGVKKLVNYFTKIIFGVTLFTTERQTELIEALSEHVTEDEAKSIVFENS